MYFKNFFLILLVLRLIRSEYYKGCEVPFAFTAKESIFQISVLKESSPIRFAADNYLLKSISNPDTKYQSYVGFFCRESVLTEKNGPKSETLEPCEQYLKFTLGQWGSQAVNPTMRCFYVVGVEKTDPTHLIIINEPKIPSPFELIEQANSYVLLVKFLKELITFMHESSIHILPFHSQTVALNDTRYWMKNLILDIRGEKLYVRYRLIDHSAKLPTAENDSFNPMASELMLLIKRLLSANKGCKHFVYQFEVKNSEISPASFVEKMPDFLEDPEAVLKVVENQFKKRFMDIGPYEYLIHKKVLKLFLMYYCVFRPQSQNKLMQSLSSLMNLLPEPRTLLDGWKDPSTLIEYFVGFKKQGEFKQVWKPIANDPQFDLLFKLQNIE